MPDTPVYAITYPCAADPVNASVFSIYATDVENAIASVDADATAATHVPYAFAIITVNPAFGVETVMAMTASSASGVTVGASTFTAVTAGLYAASVSILYPQSTLTMTSQRVAVAVNGINVVVCKWRGNNPADVGVFGGAYSTNIFLAVGDTVSFRYLWTGTGALTSPESGTGSLSLLATP